MSAAVAFPPVEAVSGADPRFTVPATKATVPVGAVLPLAGVTVTVRTVDAPWSKLAGFAATDAVVAVNGAVTVTATAAETDPPKLELPP